MKIECRVGNCCQDCKDSLHKSFSCKLVYLTSQQVELTGNIHTPIRDLKVSLMKVNSLIGYPRVQKWKKRYLEETISFTPLYEDNIFHLFFYSSILDSVSRCPQLEEGTFPPSCFHDNKDFIHLFKNDNTFSLTNDMLIFIWEL